MDSYLDYDKIIGYILSMLFGLVFKDVLSSFGKINDTLMQFKDCRFSYSVSLLATITYCANIFRMLHGFIISLYDKRNPTSFGPYPFGFREMVVLVAVFIVPLVSEEVIKTEAEPLKHLELIFFLYQLPSLAYIIWDTTLWGQLNRYRLECCDLQKESSAKQYLKFVYNWLIIDIINIVLFFATFYCLEKTDLKIYYYHILFIFTIINILTFMGDYAFFNHDFYFKKQDYAS